MGYSDFRRSYGMIGVFVDADGVDSYTSSQRNNPWSMKSTYGVFVDTSASSPARDVSQDQTTESASMTQSLTDALPLASSLDSLFIQASAAPLRFQPNVEPARRAISSRGASALPFLANQMSTSMPRERITLETVLPDIYAAAPDATRDVLHTQLRSRTTAASALASTVLIKVRDTTCIPDLVTLAHDDEWRKRRLAVFAWGELRDTVHAYAFAHLLRDPIAYVRQRAAYAFAKLPGISFDSIRSALNDEEQTVRNSAVEGLLRGGKRRMSDVRSWCSNINDDLVLRSNLRLIACSDTTQQDVEVLARWYTTASSYLREMLDHTLASLPRPWAELNGPILEARATPSRKRKQRRQVQ